MPSQQFLFILLFISYGTFTVSCIKKDTWELSYKIELDDVEPYGITANAEGIWISDKVHNSVYLIDTTGNILESFDDINKPGFISSDEGSIFIPESGSDQILQLWHNRAGIMITDETFKNPTAVSVHGEGIVVADPSERRVAYFDGLGWQYLVPQVENGELQSPINVEISEKNIVMVNVLYNQIQLFNRSGEWHSLITLQKGFNPSGLCIQQNEIFVTDIEKNLVHVVDFTGKLIQTIDKNLDQPTDLCILGNRLIIANRGSQQLLVYRK